MAVFHKHLIIRAEVSNPPTEEELAKSWMVKLIDKIGMKLALGPFAKYINIPGNRGITCMAIIETSHLAMHVWDEGNPGLVQLDVYTCGALDPYDVVVALREFHPIRIEMKYLDREKQLLEIPLE